MWRASAVSHHTPKSENPKPVANANGTTRARGEFTANTMSWIGQMMIRSSPARSGRFGRQRTPISAPTSAPAPVRVSSRPNTPALP